MTYSLEHAPDGQRLNDLLDTLIDDVSELRHLLTIYGDAMDLPGRRPPADPDRTGRQATNGPSRPTEDTALDGARASMWTAVEHGVTRVARATALVRGTTAEMDRALGEWEGEPAYELRGVHEGASGAAEYGR